jgi:hypothetical protein
MLAGFDAHAADYHSGGYRDVDACRAAAAAFELRDFGQSGGADTAPLSQRLLRRAKRGLMRWALQEFGDDAMDYFEFGVMDCRTFNRVIELVQSADARFYGFDSFDGLPLPWVKARGTSVAIARAAGELKASRAPAVYDARAKLYRGLFHDTLAVALGDAFPDGRQPGRRLFINIDSDLYASALVLASMHPLLRSDDLVYFDEFLDAMNEFAAFNDYIRAFGSRDWFIPVARARASLRKPVEN